jgi:CHAT domain-containing protein
LARAAGANPDTVWLGEQATETRVKSQDLSQYRMLAFATHAVMAGEMNGLAQPGLIFTPPSQATAKDDGYLTAGEIATLKLNADWVLLSACNTAAPDGTPGAEGFSGLAKAFFYAGARSLMVSHWSVESVATVALSTGTLQAYASKPGLGKAAALREAMLTVMRTPSFSHPLYWAPFVLVGEGSR